MQVFTQRPFFVLPLSRRSGCFSPHPLAAWLFSWPSALLNSWLSLLFFLHYFFPYPFSVFNHFSLFGISSPSRFKAALAPLTPPFSLSPFFLDLFLPNLFFSPSPSSPPPTFPHPHPHFALPSSPSPTPHLKADRDERVGPRRRRGEKKDFEERTACRLRERDKKDGTG